MVHVEPFHWATSVRVPLKGFEDEPAVKQLIALAHDTPESELDDPDGPGLATIDQFLPFHCSIRAEPFADGPPTAAQLFALVQDTLSRRLTVAFDGLGLGTTDQVVPFHRSTSVTT
jgi:hypothetical protein